MSIGHSQFIAARLTKNDTTTTARPSRIDLIRMLRCYRRGGIDASARGPDDGARTALKKTAGRISPPAILIVCSGPVPPR
jgi:hypothetical protein